MTAAAKPSAFARQVTLQNGLVPEVMTWPKCAVTVHVSFVGTGIPEAIATDSGGAPRRERGVNPDLINDADQLAKKTRATATQPRTKAVSIRMSTTPNRGVIRSFTGVSPMRMKPPLAG